MIIATILLADIGTASADSSFSWLWIALACAGVVIGVILWLVLRAGAELKTNMKLVVTRGAHTGGEFRITSAFMTVGSDPDNDIVLTDDKVSRHHARLRLAKGVLTVIDANSLYGTFVNGQRVEKQVCAGGDTIAFSPEAECRVEM